MLKEFFVDYKISLYPSQYDGWQSKKGNKGYIKAYVSTIWCKELSYKDSYDEIDNFVIGLICIYIVERICLERAFQKIKIKGGMCNPCCVQNCSKVVMDFILND